MRVTERDPKETGRDYAFRMLRENIISLELAPGSMLSEKELADELGLSRTPVREALIELTKGGAVEVFPQRGSKVALIDYHWVEEAYFMRNALECAVVESICGKLSEEQYNELEENVQLQKFYLDRHSPDKLLEMDDSFHQQLFQIAKKPHVYLLMGCMFIHFDRVRSMSLSVVKDIKIVSDHAAILEAIKNGEPEHAVRLMEKHLKRYKIDEADLRQEYPSYFRG